MTQFDLTVLMTICSAMAMLLAGIVTWWVSRINTGMDAMQTRMVELAKTTIENSSTINLGVQKQITETNLSIAQNYVPRRELDDRFQKIDLKQERTNDKLDKILESIGRIAK